MPPIFNVVEADKDKVPPAEVLLQVNVLKSNVPEVTDKLPATEVLTPRVVEVLLLMVRLLKVVEEPLMVWVAPLKVMVPVPAVKVPEFDQLPPTVCVNEPPENVDPLPIEKFPDVLMAAPAVAVVLAPEIEKLP